MSIQQTASARAAYTPGLGPPQPMPQAVMAAWVKVAGEAGEGQSRGPPPSPCTQSVDRVVL